MIIGTWDREQIGTVILGGYRYTQTKDIPLILYVIREATYEEWIEYRRNEGRLLELNGREREAHFYEVSTD